MFIACFYYHEDNEGMLLPKLELGKQLNGGAGVLASSAQAGKVSTPAAIMMMTYAVNGE